MKKWLILVCFASSLHAADEKQWSWKDGKGVEHSRAELLAILQDCGCLGGPRRKPLNLRGADLHDADLIRTNLANADLVDANLHGARLSGAILNNADLTRADLMNADLSMAEINKADLTDAGLLFADLTDAVVIDAHLRGAELGGTHLVNAQLTGSDLTKADLREADLTEATLIGTDLEGANLGAADLTHAYFHAAILINTDFTGANLNGAEFFYDKMHGYYHRRNRVPENSVKPDLTGANLTGASLTAANFGQSDLSDVLFEPKDSLSPENIAQGQNLDRMRWNTNSSTIISLRKSLLDGGFLQQSRQVNTAFHRSHQVWLQRLLFDWTCEWGLNWVRPLLLMAAISILCTFIYWISLRFNSSSGLYIVATGRRVVTAADKERVFRISICPPEQTIRSDQLELPLEPKLTERKKPRSFKYRVRLEFRALGTAFLFSLMSVFNIGFRELNFGQWIRLLQPRQFDIRAVGWVRTVSGIQSLLGVALVALSLLSYFGQPFD